MHHTVYKLPSPCGKDECIIEYTGSQHGLHFWTKATACAYEVRYLFMRQFLDGAVNFSVFYKNMSYNYAALYDQLWKCISVNTFLC